MSSSLSWELLEVIACRNFVAESTSSDLKCLTVSQTLFVLFPGSITMSMLYFFIYWASTIMHKKFDLISSKIKRMTAVFVIL